jgi:hypothetical protein
MKELEEELASASAAVRRQTLRPKGTVKARLRFWISLLLQTLAVLR